VRFKEVVAIQGVQSNSKKTPTAEKNRGKGGKVLRAKILLGNINYLS